MLRFLGASVIASTLALAALPAAAMPVGSTSAGSSGPAVTLVSGGCGIYFHRGPFGRCVPNRPGPVFGPRWRGVYHPGWRRPAWRRWR